MRRVLAAVILLLMAGIAAGCAVLNSLRPQNLNTTKELLNGELLIGADGLYTKIHYFENSPEKSRNFLSRILRQLAPPSFAKSSEKSYVLLVGTVPQAEPIYYILLERMLNVCDYVIYDGPPWQGFSSQGADYYYELLAQEKLFGQDIEDVFEAADFIFPPGMLQQLGLMEERKYWDFSKRNWISGDALWHRQQIRDQEQSFWRSFRERTKAIPAEIKVDLAHRFHEFSRRVEKGIATRHDFFKWLKTRYGANVDALAPLRELYMQERQEFAMKIFDNLVYLRKPKTICIKFNAAHIAFFRRELKKREYLEIPDIVPHEIKAITIPQW